MMEASDITTPYFIGSVFDSLIEKCIEQTVLNYIQTLSDSIGY